MTETPDAPNLPPYGPIFYASYVQPRWREQWKIHGSLKDARAAVGLTWAYAAGKRAVRGGQVWVFNPAVGAEWQLLHDVPRDTPTDALPWRVSHPETAC